MCEGILRQVLSKKALAQLRGWSMWRRGILLTMTWCSQCSHNKITTHHEKKQKRRRNMSTDRSGFSELASSVAHQCNYTMRGWDLIRA